MELELVQFRYLITYLQMYCEGKKMHNYLLLVYVKIYTYSRFICFFLLSCSHGKGLHLMLITTHMKNNVYIPDVDSACWVKNTMHTFQYVALTGSGNLNCLRDTRRVSEHRENFDHMCKAPARPDLYQLISAPSFNWKLLKVKN